ncbi:MAG: DUF2851 family protein, partial [Chloroflexi bacterium]|nr:DUF2851 family protein [Chloroflexota bacterium]
MAEGSKEHLIARVWQSGILSREWLTADCGEVVQAVYPGWRNTGDGPDFRGAIIMTAGGRLLSGDVEIHFRAGDWRSHGHHRNPAYNNVVLQVAWDGTGLALLQNSKVAPTVRLGPLLRRSVAELQRRADSAGAPSEPCHHVADRLGGDRLGRLLDDAGEQRFRLRADGLQARLSREPAEEVIYQGMMRALGYSRNSDAMEDLAIRLP